MTYPTYNPALRGYLYMIVAGFCFALMASAGRVASQDVDPLFVTWVRGFGGAVLLVPFMLVKGISFFGYHRKMLALRALLGTISVSLLFFSVSRAPLVDVITLVKTSSLYVPLFAAFFLREKLERWVMTLTLVGFSGVVLVVQPGFKEMNIGLITGLLTGIMQALTWVTIRGVSHVENPLTIVFYFLAGNVVFLLPFVPWPTAEVAWQISHILLLTIVPGLLGQLFLTGAYRKAPAGRVAPLLYTEIIFAALLGWIMLGEIPTASKCIGMAIICATGCVLAARARG